MRNLRVIIFIGIMVFLIIVIGIVSKSELVKKQTAKTKLEQAIKEVPVEDNIIDILSVKDKINDINDSTIINEDTTYFPVYTLVDGYEFKVKADGRVEDTNSNDINRNMENNIKEDDNKKDDDKEEEDISIKKETIVKYNDETKTDKGITISTTKEGIVTISGKTRKKLFIKISNNIKISEDIESFITWEEQERYID